MNRKTTIPILLLTAPAQISHAQISDAQAQSNPALERVATVPIGAEVTGLAVHNGDIFMNYQHPSSKNHGIYKKAAVGVIANANLTQALALPKGDDKKKVMTSLGTWQILIQPGTDGIGVINGEESDQPDFNSYIPTGENEGYLFTNWEERPGGMSRIKLTRSNDGTYTLSDKTMLDFSKVNGTWLNCFGSTSPWNTPLSAEELYFDDTADWNNERAKAQSGVAAASKTLAQYPNPYDYGFIVEITDPTGSATPVKHKVMGRFSHENAYVLPDEKTAYLSDDGAATVLFKFVADQAGDLSAGTLYAAKLTQSTASGADLQETSFAIEWIELAHGTDAEVEKWAREYDGISPKDYQKGETNYISDQAIEDWANGQAQDNRAAFLESRKAAKAKGATAEFVKMEGVAYNGAHVLVAMTSITKTMSDKSGDIQLAENPCGAVFKLTLDAQMNATKMEPYIIGGPYSALREPNNCAVDNIASPDNIIALSDGSILIGEDSGHHQNNMLWRAQ